jgi:hypothetical protein
MRSRHTLGVVRSGGRALVMGLAATFLVACTSVSQGGGESSLMDATGTKVSTEALRASQSVLLIQVPGAIESSADSMAAETTDPVLRRRALMWKIELVPAYYQALFNPDPLAGLLDAWAMTVQLEGYLQAGPGSAWKPLVLSHALAGVHKVRSDIEVIARQVAKSPEGFQKAQAYVERWAKAHPIEGTLAGRPSILTELAVTASKASDISVFQVVGNLPATVNDIGERLDIYAAYLPKTARWQAALMVDELSDRAEAQELLATMQSVQVLTARTNLLLSPEALQNAMATATGEVRKERLAAFASIDALKQDALTYVTSERVAAVAALDAERQAVMVDIAAERVAVLQSVDELRKRSIVDADELASRIIRRGALSAAALLLLAAFLTVVVLRVGPRARRAVESRLPPRHDS